MALYMFPASECTPFSLTELENIIRHLDNVIYDDVLAEWMEAPWAWKAHGDYRTAELSALIETIEHLEPPTLQEAAEARQQGHGRAIRFTWELAYNNADPRHWNNYAEFYEDMRRWKQEADLYLANLELILQEDRRRRREREYHRILFWPTRFTYRDPLYGLQRNARQSMREATRQHPYWPRRPETGTRQVHFDQGSTRAEFTLDINTPR